MSEKPRHYSTGGNFIPPPTGIGDAAYWRERYEIERGEVEVKDAEIARLARLTALYYQGAQDALAEVARLRADRDYEANAHREMSATAAERTAELLRAEQALQQAHAERDALADALRHRYQMNHAPSANCDGCRLAGPALASMETGHE